MNMVCGTDCQKKIIEALAGMLKQEDESFRLCETHLSWVLISGGFAYKIKKALHFDFVDYSTLSLRKHFCEEELRLNRRLAPTLYLDVIAITGSCGDPILGGQGEAIEFALKMRAIEANAFWDVRLSGDQIDDAEIDQLADILAAFHENAARVALSEQWGMPDVIRSTALSNLRDMQRYAKEDVEKAYVKRLEDWLATQIVDLAPFFLKRREEGFIRECHGDLHLGNIITEKGAVAIFDCIEFNESLRWIDVINDFSFTYMELEFHDCRRSAARLLNRYLERTGDYDALRILPFYTANRAMVRCKVAFLKAAQSLADEAEAEKANRRAAAYLAYTCAGLAGKKTCLMITHGFSGSGKSTLARKVVELTGAIQLRSDVERRRLFGLSDGLRSDSSLNEGLYRAENSEQVYERLADLACGVLESGFSVIVDAAFLQRRERLRFQELAERKGVPFHLFDLQAGIATMRSRISTRRREGKDPSEATQTVLEYQLSHHDSLSEDEMAHVLAVDMDSEFGISRLKQICKPILAKVG